MGGEVRRVGLRAERFVEAGPRVGRFVETCISWVHGQVQVMVVLLSGFVEQARVIACKS